MHLPGACRGAIALVANNSHRTNDKNKRYVYHLLYMPNQQATGSVMWTGADTFADWDFPPYVINPDNEQKREDRAPQGQGPPHIPPFHVGSRQSTTNNRTPDESSGDGRKSPDYEDVNDIDQPAQIALVDRRSEVEEVDDDDDPRTVDLCHSDDGDPNASNNTTNR